jgi:PiT family inorganic phosphate transporter
MERALVVLVLSLLAWANGANDVSKGVATLVGSGVASYRRAIAWGAGCTGLGAAVASVVSAAMLKTFGNGLLAADVAPSFSAAIASLAGAAGWVLVATRASLPVSTTHALLGSAVGAAVAAYGGGGVAWPVVGQKVVVPLFASPLAAFLLARLATRALSRSRTADCVCLSAQPAIAVEGLGTATAAFAPRLAVSVRSGHTAECTKAVPEALPLTSDHLHWLSSGAVSFARGLNDAPKIVGLATATALLASPESSIGSTTLFTLATTSMVLGGVLAGRRVTRVLAYGVTPMDPREGLAANLVTAALVAAGAVYGLPMSTTHVSSGGIAGMGAERGSVHWAKVREIGGAWLVTLPAAAVLGALAYGLATLASL